MSESDEEGLMLSVVVVAGILLGVLVLSGLVRWWGDKSDGAKVEPVQAPAQAGAQQVPTKIVVLLCFVSALIGGLVARQLDKGKAQEALDRANDATDRVERLRRDMNR